MKRIDLPILLCVVALPLAARAGVEFAPKAPDARPVSFLSSTTVVINWTTEKPCETKLQLREGTYIAGTPGYEDVWTNAAIIQGLNEKTRQHSLMLTGLKPATRYFYRAYDPGYTPRDEKAAEWQRVWSYDPPWRREYAFATRAKRGEKAIVRIPVKVLLCPNVINLSTVEDGTKKPEPMSDEEIRMYEDDLRRCALFYWINSGMRYWIDLHFFTEPGWLKVGNPPADLDAFYKGWQNARDVLRVFDPEDTSNHAAVWPFKDKTIWPGQAIISCTRGWNKDEQEWQYQGSGGWTFGADWMAWGLEWGDKNQRPAPGRSGFLGGGDIAWLFCHEYHHQKESQYNYSGLEQEGDRVVFCHFAPKYKSPMGADWQWCTAFAHGEHYDGIAWALRMLTATQYLRNMFGSIYVAKDADGDGVPDDDAKLPLDEKRFGSDPAKASTDGSGMTDLEKIMSAKWVPTALTRMRQKVYNPGYPPMWYMASKQELPSSDGTGYAWPKAKVQDSDGDGIIDKDDPYPIYPWPPSIQRATITIDGKPDEWTALPVLGRFKAAGVEFAVKAAYDMDNVYYGMQVIGDVRSITLHIDGDDDGWYVSDDNLQVRIAPGAAGDLEIVEAVTHLCGSREWPHFDHGAPSIRKHKVKKDDDTEIEEEWRFKTTKRYGGKEDVTAASTTSANRRFIEFAIPNGDATFPIQVGPNHTFSHAIYVGIPDKGAVPVYEAYTLFKLTAE